MFKKSRKIFYAIGIFFIIIVLNQFDSSKSLKDYVSINAFGSFENRNPPTTTTTATTAKTTTIISYTLKDFPNYFWTFNNNILQYSSYILIENASNSSISSTLKLNTFFIESLFLLNYKKIGNQTKDDFICFIRTISTQDIIKLMPVELFKLVHNVNTKIRCLYNSSNSINPNDIAIAIIRKADYAEQMSTDEKLEVLPYSQMNFQIPDKIQIIEPRIKSVALCVQYLHAVPIQGYNEWIKIHKNLGYSKIFFYDATRYQNVSESVFDKDFVEIKPFVTNKTLICNHEKFNNISKQLCEEFVETDLFVQFGTSHTKLHLAHEQITANDCFSVMSQQYEFVAIYDLDEFIFPRDLKVKDFFLAKQELPKCDDYKKICKEKIFTKNIYKYLNELIDEKGKDKSKVASLLFSHAAFLFPDFLQKKLFADIESLIDQYDNISNKSSVFFPLKIFMSELPKSGHTFTIEENDIEYIRYLMKAYDTFKCFHQRHLSNIKSLDTLFVRFLFFFTEFQQRCEKSIHYSKNVMTVQVHYPDKIRNGAFNLKLDPLNGHFQSHFRYKNTNFFKKNFTNSIRNVNFDFEYFYFMLSNHTNVCRV